jgi:hypothetical protein
VTIVWNNNVCPYPWRAYFEDLEIFCGIGFLHSNIVEQRLTAYNHNDSNLPKGIFMWDKTCIESMNKCKKDGVMTPKDK